MEELWPVSESSYCKKDQEQHARSQRQLLHAFHICRSDMSVSHHL